MRTGDGEGLHVRVGESAGCNVLRVAGTLGVGGYPRLRDLMLKCSADQPSAVIVVVEELRVTTASLLNVFAQVAMRLSHWPGVPVLLVAQSSAARRILERPPVARFVLVYPSVEQAVRGAAAGPRQCHAKITLLRLPGTARRARDHVRLVCEHWMPGNGIVGDAVLVANELVENVLTHTLSEPSLRLELRRKRFSVAVSDLSPVQARIREGGGGHRGGLGSLLVAQLATAWGSNPAMSGGKVVWAVLDRPADDHVRALQPHRLTFAGIKRRPRRGGCPATRFR
ncbi:ATP-binding protein [Amycolatopsis sp. YIM 10]|uniref:ATP-binding protein n=1 Tax=Amycolatopsis sp. YIM 10 TaxID=2653857 RepID=UPI00129005FB|nr:ATP-binding protein [Amycolatopsis sp. YIM 10]QFU86638.1 hypothetical protein YIM_07135 [Amycolatopsis sp. YIM 10]